MKALKRIFIITLTGFTCLGSRGATSSYTTDPVPSGYYDLLTWCFQAKDLNHIFNTNDQTILIEVYKNGAYDTSYSLGNGFEPNFTLQPGQAFFLCNWGTSNRAFTITGNLVTNSPVWLALTNTDWNAVGPAYLRANDYLECVQSLTNLNHTPPYTHSNWNYHSTTNDLVYQWSIQRQNWEMNQVASDPRGVMTPYYTNSVYGTSPTVCSGRGFFIKPAVSKLWTQYQTPSCCDSGCVNFGPFVCPQ